MKDKLIFSQPFVDFLRGQKEKYDKEMKEETVRQQASGQKDMSVINMLVGSLMACTTILGAYASESEMEEKALPSPYVTLNNVYTWIDVGQTNTEVTELVVSCSDFDAYKKLPEALFYKKMGEKTGVVCGKKGWNSDTGVAYYGSNKAVAQVV